MSEEKKRIMCAVLEAKYIQIMKEKPEYFNLEKRHIMAILFPNGWYRYFDYDKKMQFLSEAIMSKTNLLKLPSIIKHATIAFRDESIKYNNDNL